MNLLSVSGTMLHRQSHGYFLARRFFAGDLKREVFVTVVDIKNRRSYYGYLFLTEKNALLTILKNRECQVYAFDRQDRYEQVPADPERLRRALTDTGYDINLYVSTSHPVSFIKINSDYLLLSDV